MLRGNLDPDVLLRKMRVSGQTFDGRVEVLPAAYHVPAAVVPYAKHLVHHQSSYQLPPISEGQHRTMFPQRHKSKEGDPSAPSRTSREKTSRGNSASRKSKNRSTTLGNSKFGFDYVVFENLPTEVYVRGYNPTWLAAQQDRLKLAMNWKLLDSIVAELLNPGIILEILLSPIFSVARTEFCTRRVTMHLHGEDADYSE